MPKEDTIDFVTFCLSMLSKTLEKYPPNFDEGMGLGFKMMDRDKACAPGSPTILMHIMFDETFVFTSYQCA